MTQEYGANKRGGNWDEFNKILSNQNTLYSCRKFSNNKNFKKKNKMANVAEFLNFMNIIS